MKANANKFILIFFCLLILKFYSSAQDSNSINQNVSNINNTEQKVNSASNTFYFFSNQFKSRFIQNYDVYRSNYLTFKNAGISSNMLGNYPESLEIFFQAYCYADSLDDNFLLAESSNLIGETLLNSELNEIAFQYFNKSLSLIKNEGSKLYISSIYSNIGTYYIKTGKYDIAKKYILESLDSNLANNMHKEALRDKIKLVKIDYLQNKYDTAYSYLKNIIQDIKLTNDRILFIEALSVFNDIIIKKYLNEEANPKINKESIIKLCELLIFQEEILAKSLRNEKLLLCAYTKFNNLYNLSNNDKKKNLLREKNSQLLDSYLEKNNNSKITNIVLNKIMNKILGKQKTIETNELIFIILSILILLSGGAVFLKINFFKKNKTLLEEQKAELQDSKHELEILFENLSLAKRDLEIANATKNKFISIMAHDIKNPLQGIMLASEFLLLYYDNISKEKILTNIQSIINSSMQLNSLLDSILNWARIQNNSIELNKIMLNPYEICNNAITVLNEISDYKKINILNNIDENIMINADENVIFTVLRNLISNSIKFTNRGGKIIIGYDIFSNYFYVIDNGIGMSEKIVNSLFNIHTCYRREGTGCETGSGIGLVLCKELISKHGGEIWASSEVNIGSTFYFSL